MPLSKHSLNRPTTQDNAGWCLSCVKHGGSLSLKEKTFLTHLLTHSTCLSSEGMMGQHHLPVWTAGSLWVSPSHSVILIKKKDSERERHEARATRGITRSSLRPEWVTFPASSSSCNSPRPYPPWLGILPCSTQPSKWTLCKRGNVKVRHPDLDWWGIFLELHQAKVRWILQWLDAGFLKSPLLPPPPTPPFTEPLFSKVQGHLS